MEKNRGSLTLLQNMYADDDDDDAKNEKKEDEDDEALGTEGFGEVEFVDIHSLFEVQDFGETDVNPHVMNLEMKHSERDDIVHPQEEEEEEENVDDDDDDEDDEKGSLEFQSLYDLAFKNKKMVANCYVEEDSDDDAAEDDDVDYQQGDVEQVQEQQQVEIESEYV